MPLLRKLKSQKPRRLRPVRFGRSPSAQIRGAFREIAGKVRPAVLTIRRARRAASRAALAPGGENLAARRSIAATLTDVAAAFRSLAARFENEARSAMAEAGEIRKTLPKLLEPRREIAGGTAVLVFELGQALTAREAFAAALDLAPDETTLGQIGERRGFLPRLDADAVSSGSTSPVVVLTRLRRSERRFMVWPGRQPRTLLAPRGGALLASGGRAHTFYFPGTATLPAGTKIVLPAAALAS